MPPRRIKTISDEIIEYYYNILNKQWDVKRDIGSGWGTLECDLHSERASG